MPKIDRTPPPDLGDVPVDHLPVSVRAYVTLKPKKKEKRKYERDETQPQFTSPTDWVLVFDCETRTTPDQALRFGAYQLRNKGRLIERGTFFDDVTLDAEEMETLRSFMDREEPGPEGERVCLRTRDEFVDQVFYGRGYKLGAQIVGFNLPFDISRIALGFRPSRRDMKGGFSFVLVDDKTYNNVSVKHLSQRASWIRFVGTKKNKRWLEDDDDEQEENDFESSLRTDRGFFVDVKTFAAALMSESHSLESLCHALQTKTRKKESDDHGKKLKPKYIRYALTDVQATWECFTKLTEKYAALGLSGTEPHRLYSEASLGKAYLKEMGIKPWRHADYKLKRLGQIMSTYYGGRAEVHIRRQPVPVIHCDFLSMYPTVCTLMGLWQFVTAIDMSDSDDTKAIQKFVENCSAEQMRDPSQWRNLAAIVQVLPQRDLFPVRARYAGDSQATIGLNYLTNNDEKDPMWFTLADVLVSKILSGRTPKIIRALRFSPGPQQPALEPVTVSDRRIDPSQDDFYRSLIEHRLELEDQKNGKSKRVVDQLEAERKTIKILANATSYGIFVELNIKNYVRKKAMLAHGVRDRVQNLKSDKLEQPGQYFHPLLGTLITGAARLMLALAERLVIDQGLDWAFCDTDSIAIANASNFPLPEFRKRALRVCDWFKGLNPYGRTESILQLEKVNFPAKKRDKHGSIDPPHCLAVSAKRYVLYNKDARGAARIRKASAHGLGHLLAPYEEPKEKRRDRLKAIGVYLWQENLWKDIIRASDTEDPDVVRYTRSDKLRAPAASQYAANNTNLHGWFSKYNESKPYRDQVKPFNFLLSLHAKSKIEMQRTDPAALKLPLWKNRIPRPAAPFYSKVEKALPFVFDRDFPQRTSIEKTWLESYRRNLSDYHLHPERKFYRLGNEPRGLLKRRHVEVISFEQIGKEADNIDEREVLGDDEDDLVEYDSDRRDIIKMRKFIVETQEKLSISDRTLISAAHLSKQTLAKVRSGKVVRTGILRRLISALEQLRQQKLAEKSSITSRLERLKQLRQMLGSDEAVAKVLNFSRSFVTRLLRNERRIAAAVDQRVRKALVRLR